MKGALWNAEGAHLGGRLLVCMDGGKYPQAEA